MLGCHPTRLRVRVCSAKDDDRLGVLVITPEDVQRQVRLCESVEAAYSAHGEAAAVLAALGGEARSVRLDSQAKYATVARGQADLYLRMPTRPGYVERIWDHAAGMLVAEEAGAIVTDITGKALDFNHGWGLEENRGVVCAHPALHQAVIEAIGA